MRTLLLVIIAVVIPRDAHAYLDAGTGSMILQGALAALFGLGFTMKMYWHRLKSMFRKPEIEDAKEPVQAEGESPPA